MHKPLRILILEDDSVDCDLSIAMLEKAGYSCQWSRVETREGFVKELHNSTYDLILADYRLPAFNGLAALELFNEENLNIPFIIVSGTLGEELAIESLHAGATDYVLKQRLDRLGPVVKRALRLSEEQQRRIQAEDELRKLYQAVEQSPVSIVITDLAGAIVYANPKFTNVTGYTLEEVLGQNPRLLKGINTPEEVYKQLWETITTGKEWHGEFHNKRKDGSYFWEKAFITAIKNSNDNITHYLAIKEDITERKNIEEQARQQERLASIGQLASGIAHDFNNILAVISLYSDLLAGQDLAEESLKLVRTISNQSIRAAKLIEQILDFSRRAVLERAPMELSYLLIELVRLWKRTLPDDIAVVSDYGTEAYSIFADPQRIQQLLMNLVINARDAMPDGGTLTIALRRIRIKDQPNEKQVGLTSGDWVQIQVSDTGLGIPSDILPQLYEPFFTTKERGAGTGLGLAQVYGIVKQHDGEISVVSEVGKGTTFTISLPAIPKSETEEEVETAVIHLGHGELILIVEDDEFTGNALADSLNALNYRVKLTDNGHNALAVIKELKDEINLIICDHAMPEMNGEELLRKLRTFDNDIPFVFLSAYLEDTALERLKTLGALDILSKPIQLGELSGYLDQIFNK